MMHPPQRQLLKENPGNRVRSNLVVVQCTISTTYLGSSVISLTSLLQAGQYRSCASTERSENIAASMRRRVSECHEALSVL